MLLLGLDVETTGLDGQKDRIIEIGAVLWDTALNQPVKILSELILEKPDLLLNQDIVELTGITVQMLQQFGKAPDDLLFAALGDMLAQCDACVAHNAAFDRSFMTAFYQRWKQEFPKKPWICTVSDIDYPKGIRSKSLIYLAGAHGFANPFSHRAVTDVLSMLKILSAYDVTEVLENANTPKLEVVAVVEYENRHLAKEAGFRWDGKAKKWKKKVRANQFNPKGFPFEVQVISE